MGRLLAAAANVVAFRKLRREVRVEVADLESCDMVCSKRGILGGTTEKPAREATVFIRSSA